MRCGFEGEVAVPVFSSEIATTKSHPSNRERNWRLACLLWAIMDPVNSTSLRGNDEELESLLWIAAYVVTRNDAQ